MIARVHASVLVYHGADETCQVSLCGLTDESAFAKHPLGQADLVPLMQGLESLPSL
jgi:hypothetical protein